MFDIFNKKKVENLERELRIVRNEFERDRGELIALRKYKDVDRISNQLADENQKLIRWISNILDTFGTMEVRERHNVQIPIYKPESYRAYDCEHLGLMLEEKITIPEITIIKMR